MKHLAAIWAVFLVSSGPPLLAERLYTLGARLSAVGSLDNNPQVSGVGLQQTNNDLAKVYGFYPSLYLDSSGPDSNFLLSYSLGLDRVDTDLDLNSESHTFSGRFSTRLGRRFNLQVSESFTRSPDFATNNLFHGILFTPEGIFFDTETITLRRNSYFNRTSLSLGYDVSPRSRMSFTMGHFIRTYEREDFNQALTDQQQWQGSLNFSRILNNRNDFGFGYTISQRRFDQFQNAQTHYVALVFHRELTPNTHLNMNAGPSYTRALGVSESFLGGSGSLSISQSFEENLISLSFRQTSGDATGVGSVSDTRSLGFSFSRPIGRKTTLSLGIRSYDTNQRLDNPVELRGVSTSILVNFGLTPNWFIGLGGSYQDQAGTETFGLERKRIFVSLTYQLPELARFTR